MSTPSPIEQMVLKAVRCGKCGAPYGKCDCWTKCACGWLYEKGASCRNPVHDVKPDAQP